MVIARKQALKDQLVAHVTAALDTARRAHAAAVEGATHSESRAENDKDTRGLEQSYLARGQAQRVLELEVELAEVSAMAVRPYGVKDAVGTGALVTVEEDGDSIVYFVAPHGGGVTLDGGRVQVLTARSPLGKVLVGKRVDDEVEVRVKDKLRELVVVSIE